MKWIKRLLLVVAVIAVLVGCVSMYSYHLAHGTPYWYLPQKLTAAELKAARNAATQKFADTLSYAGGIAAAHQRQRHEVGGATHPAEVIEPKTITLSEPEINAFFEKWSHPQPVAAEPSAEASADGPPEGSPEESPRHRPNSIQEKISKYVTDPRLVLVDNKLVIAGTLNDMGFASDTIASIEFEPSVDDQGRLWLKLGQVYSGRLPVPRSLLDSQLQKLKGKLAEDLPKWQDSATVNPDGTANKFTVEAAMAKLLLSSLNDQPASPVIFLPAGAQNLKAAVPVKLTEVKIGEKSLSFTVRPLSEPEMKDVLPDVQKPYVDPNGITGAQ